MQGSNPETSATQTAVTQTPAGPVPVSAEALAHGYEPGRLGFRWYVIFVIGLIASAIVIHLLLWVMLRGFESASSHEDVRNSAMQSAQDLRPPGPPLQPSPAQGAPPRQPWQDMASYRVHEAELLRTYGRDEATGQVRIPIDRAMELLVQKGLPTTQPAMQLPRAATRQLNPESSGGR